jgi:hypothetical protein
MNNAVVQFFSKMPAALTLYEAAEKKILAMPNVQLEVKRSQISFRSRRVFAWIWLPIRRIKNRPEIYIIMTFGLDHQIISPRIIEAIEPYPNRWTHHLIIEKTSDIDEEVMCWLQQTYMFAQSH